MKLNKNLGRAVLGIMLGGLIAQSAMAEQKALLIGIDGLQLEQLQAINPPNFRRLEVKRAYIGGIDGDAGEHETSSTPGWTTILTGMWANKHGNVTYQERVANAEAPTIFRYLKQANSSIQTVCANYWSPICGTIASRDSSFMNHVLTGSNDADVTNKVIQRLEAGADFTFVQLDNVDAVGHAQGYGAQYTQAVNTADQQLGLLLNKVEQLQQQTNDDWLVLVTTDHGRDTQGRDHGAQTRSEKTTFIASNKSLNAEFTTTPSVANTAFSSLYASPAATSIVPTILRHFGITLQRDWKLDGTPLLGSTGVRKLFKTGQNQFRWLASGNSNVEIYKNGALLDSVVQSAGLWTDSSGSTASADYSFVVSGTPISYRTGTGSGGGSDPDVPATLVDADISVALDMGSNVYFFRTDGKYVLYDKNTDAAVAGYPLAINSTSWPGVGQHLARIVTGFNAGNGKSYFFLNNGKYIQYDNANDAADGGQVNISSTTWPGLQSQSRNIKFAAKWAGNKALFFLKNGTYIQYDLVTKTVDSGFPKPFNNANWPGMQSHASKVTALVRWNDSFAYFFLNDGTYIKYNITNNAVFAGYPVATNDDSWFGLLHE